MAVVCKASVTLTRPGRPPELSVEGGLCGCPTSASDAGAVRTSIVLGGGRCGLWP